MDKLNVSVDGLYAELSSVAKPSPSFSFSNRQKQIFEGCMLGDGHLSLPKCNKNCYFVNVDKHREYVVWLQKQLGVLDISRIYPVYSDDKKRVYYGLLTKTIPSIRSEYDRWYPNGKGTRNKYHYKVIPDDIELTLIKVLFWYIGDGSYNSISGKAYFTNQLNFSDAKSLGNKLSVLLDVYFYYPFYPYCAGVRMPKGGKDEAGNQYYYIYLNKDTTKKFFSLIDSLGFDIPECYQYKFGRNKPKSI